MRIWKHFCVMSVIMLFSTNALAIAAFTKQTGQACLSCHYFDMKRLTQTGQSFRLQGLRTTGTQRMIEEDRVSLPIAINADILMDIRGSHGNTKDASGATLFSGGTLELPTLASENANPALRADGALYVAGRIAKHVGGLSRIDITGPSGLTFNHYKGSAVWESGDTIIGFSAGSTNDGGMPFIMNDPSSVISTSLTASQHQAVALDLNGTGVTSGNYSGAGLYTLWNGFYVAAAAVVPVGNEIFPSPYIRVAYLGSGGGINATIGGWFASIKPGIFNAGSATPSFSNVHTQQYGADVQLQWNAGNLNMGFYMPWQIKGEDVSTSSLAGDTSSTGLFPLFTLNYPIASSMPLGARLGFDYARTEFDGTTLVPSASRTWVLGIWINPWQNMNLDLEFINRTVNDAGGIAGASRDLDAVTLDIKYLY